MTGLVPVIHAVAPPLRHDRERVLRIAGEGADGLAAWMTGTSPVMTRYGVLRNWSGRCG
jgi:hypothetical protein